MDDLDPAKPGVAPLAAPEQVRANLSSALERILATFFETVDPNFLSEVQQRVEFLEVAAGTALLREGELGDDVYFVLAGRLRAVKAAETPNPVTLGEIGRGETVGELALILGEPRSATIFAVRDSTVARLSRADFEIVLAQAPWLGLRVARVAVDRYRRAARARRPPRKPVVVCVLPITPGAGEREFARELGDERARYGGPVPVITSDDLAQEFGEAASAECPGRHGAVAGWLARIESGSESVFLVADPGPTAWTARCVNQADEVVLLADADAQPEVSAVERALFDGDDPAPAVFQTLVLRHPADRRAPEGTARWLDRRPVARHFHLRRGRPDDTRRLARTLAGRAVGIVMAGGGARAFVHFGVVNALADAGIHPDFIGGTSMGATAAAWRAMDLTGEDYVAAGRRVYLSKPTSDINPLPLMSFIRGHKVKRLAQQAVDLVAGRQLDIEDTWIPYYCVATNLSTAEEAVLTRGNLARALLASFSIPGALPPVPIGDHLMVDGGTFNNFPVDVMERMGVGTIIGIVMAEAKPTPLGLTELPGSFELLRDRFFRRPANRKYRLPLLPEILLNSTLTASRDRQRRARGRVDLLIQPETEGVGLLDWDLYDEVIDNAYAYTKKLLSEMDPAALEGMR